MSLDFTTKTHQFHSWLLTWIVTLSVICVSFIVSVTSASSLQNPRVHILFYLSLSVISILNDVFPCLYSLRLNSLNVLKFPPTQFLGIILPSKLDYFSLYYYFIYNFSCVFQKFLLLSFFLCPLHSGWDFTFYDCLLYLSLFIFFERWPF